ncbi:GH10452 [Drosophila grimshawi]|uniref:GH10452 n=1 Tax=Drosophila grimshawi TaxID=7222 RepID=B4JE14_DROGR|nr:GH10452 [Drosophila grimshawi]
MGEDRRNSYDAVSIPSYESLSKKSESSHTSQDDIQVTKRMVYNLECEDDVEKCMNIPETPAGDFYNQVATAASQGLFSPQLMIVYADGDINCALHYLIDSLHDPFSAKSVVTVLVEECIQKEFVQRIQSQMQPLAESVATHPNYVATLEMIGKLSVKTISADKKLISDPLVSPILVCNCQHSMLGEGPTGVICLHTFRSNAEAVEICCKESFQFSSTCIWNESLEGIYQLAVAIDCPIFYFNCNNVSLSPISSDEIKLCIFDGFHYERLPINGKNKIIIFPIGAHISQKSDEPPIVSNSPIPFLIE